MADVKVTDVKPVEGNKVEFVLDVDGEEKKSVQTMPLYNEKDPNAAATALSDLKQHVVNIMQTTDQHNDALDDVKDELIDT